MSALVDPHGADRLQPLLLEEEAAAQERERAQTLTRIPITNRESGDLIMMGIGGFTPLAGFMDHADWKAVCGEMHLAGGLFWPIPITLSAERDVAASIRSGEDVALVHEETGETMATMTVQESYSIDRSHECIEVFRTCDPHHPGVEMVMRQRDVNLAGPVRVVSLGGFRERYGQLFLTPMETRELFAARGWQTVAAFQTRNPMHRSHEYLAKIAVELCDGVLIHSLLGRLRPGEIPAEVRTRAIEALIERYFVQHTVVQAGYPLDMRYAGPREALLHALFRQNYGCSHLVVGRDHAGVGDYYGPFDAQRIFEEIPADALRTRALKIDWTFWCRRCAGMASTRTCPHAAEERVLLSGGKLRKLLSEGQPVPDNFSRPEVLAILREYYRGIPIEERVKVHVTGHSAR